MFVCVCWGGCAWAIFSKACTKNKAGGGRETRNKRIVGLEIGRKRVRLSHRKDARIVHLGVDPRNDVVNVFRSRHSGRLAGRVVRPAVFESSREAFARLCEFRRGLLGNERP